MDCIFGVGTFWNCRNIWTTNRDFSRRRIAKRYQLSGANKIPNQGG
jgi:hypothetical protein